MKSISEITRKIRKRIVSKISNEVTIREVDEVAITPTLKCNLDCVMCHQGEIKCRKNMTFNEFKTILTNLKKAKVKKVSIVGGEIFILPDIWDWINEMELQGFKYDLASNLLNPTNIEMFKHLKGLEMVTTSLDGDKKIHNSIRRNDKAFQNTTKNIKILLKDDIKVDVACVIQKANFNILDKLTEIICKLGVKAITFMLANTITEEEKDKAKETLKFYTLEDVDILISSLENPLGTLTDTDYKHIPSKVESIKEVASKYDVCPSFAIQLLHPEILVKDQSLKEYTCSVLKGYNGLVFNDGEFNTCSFIKFLGEHNLLNKTPLEIMNSDVYLRKRMVFKNQGALDMCRLCCALKKKK